MGFNPDIHHRKSIRLRGYDYSQPGAYFITICTHQRQPLFGDIVGGNMMLNAAGVMVDAMWREIPDHYSSITLGEYVVMPNHFHGVVHVVAAEPVGAQFIAPHDFNQCGVNSGAINRAPTIGDVIRGFKARCTHGINQVNNTIGSPVWQRNYYEHIIRNELAYQNITEYIRTNPQKWQDDIYCTSSVQGGTKP